MKYIHKITGKIATIVEIRKEFPNSSIPEITDLSDFGYIAVIETPRPSKEGFYYIESIIDGVQTWEEYKTEVFVPKQITMRQARLYLLNAGMLSSVDALMQTNEAWKIEWEYGHEVLRNSPLVGTLGIELGLTEAQIDMMFTEASLL